MSSIASAPEVEADVIIRAMTYHRHDIDIRDDKKVISVSPVKQDKIKTCISTAFPVTSTSSSLGRLAVLPTELLFKACLELDIQSAFELREVNCRARAVVTGVYEYRAIATHATGALSVLFRTKMAKHIDLRSLYKTLTEKWCVICGRFGGFLFIPTATRCCFTCLWDKSHFPVLTLKSVSDCTKIPLGKLRSLIPVLRTVPGRYGIRGDIRYRKQRSILYSHHALEALEGLKERCAPVVWDLADRVYSREEFLDHFEQCEKAKNLWATSEGGTKDISQLESRSSINSGFDPFQMLS